MESIGKLLEFIGNFNWNFVGNYWNPMESK